MLLGNTSITDSYTYQKNNIVCRDEVHGVVTSTTETETYANK